MTFKYIRLILLFCLSHQSFGTLNVVTTTPELAWLTRSIGKTYVKVFSLTTGSENTHFLSANPSFILKVSNADLLCINGMGLEVGWIPRVLQKAANNKIKKKGIHECNASANVDKLEIPQSIDRSQGDVHAEGNPHYTFSALQMINAGKVITSALIQADASHSKEYAKSFSIIKSQLRKVYKDSLKKIKEKYPKGLSVLEYHKEFVYLFNDYGITNLGSIEETPGVPPSALRVVSVANKAKEKKADIIITTEHYPKKHAEKISEISKVPYLVFPASLREGDNYIEFHRHLIDLILGIRSS